MWYSLARCELRGSHWREELLRDVWCSADVSRVSREVRRLRQALYSAVSMIVIILLSLAVTQNIGRPSERSSGEGPQKVDIDAIPRRSTSTR